MVYEVLPPDESSNEQEELVQIEIFVAINRIDS